MKTPKLKNISISLIDDCEHPNIQLKKFYLVKIHRKYYAGKFIREWYGLNFDGVYDGGYQLDWDGWEGIWEILT